MRCLFPNRIVLLILTIVFLLSTLPCNSFAADEQQHFTEECLNCHEDYDKTLEGGIHQLQEQDHAYPVTCSHCHSRGEVHVEDPQLSNITNPSKVSAAMAAVICRTCHQADPLLHICPYTFDRKHTGNANIHYENDINCNSCHKLHNNNQPFLLKDTESKICSGCHPKVMGELSYPYRHPVRDGIMTCSECHIDLDRMSNGLTSGEASKICYGCHYEFQGPFPYEHQASMEFSTEEGSCLNCHAAHGSNLPRMLTQPLDPPNYALCSQCHMTPPGHTYNSYHEDRWAARPCGTCHVDIHGSYFSKQFLKPSLPDEEGSNCFAPVCHGS